LTVYLAYAAFLFKDSRLVSEQTCDNQDIYLLTAFKEGAYFMGMKIFNHLPTNIKILSNRIELFKPALKIYLL
jgi:hypothetical protein